MKIRRWMLGAALLGVLMLSSGCFLLLVGAGAAAGAGGVMYVKGELKSIEEVDIDTAYDSSKAVLDDMGYLVSRETTETNKKSMLGKGTYEDAGTTKKRDISITVEQVSQTQTEIRIRVDTFGDEAFSREILDKIKAKF